MHENGESKELFQKYCAHLGASVTVVKGKDKSVCLSSHLCRGQQCENRNFSAVSGIYGDNGVDINEK